MGSTKQPMSFRLRGASQIFPAEEYELGEGGHHRLREFLVPWTSFFSDAAVVQLKQGCPRSKDGRLPLEVWHHAESGNWGERATLKKVARLALWFDSVEVFDLLSL